jgi:hypothetical protein
LTVQSTPSSHSAAEQHSLHAPVAAQHLEPCGQTFSVALHSPASQLSTVQGSPSSQSLASQQLAQPVSGQQSRLVAQKSNAQKPALQLWLVQASPSSHSASPAQGIFSLQPSVGEQNSSAVQRPSSGI